MDLASRHEQNPRHTCWFKAIVARSLGAVVWHNEGDVILQVYDDQLGRLESCDSPGDRRTQQSWILVQLAAPGHAAPGLT